MDYSYTPHRDISTTLHFPSPTANPFDPDELRRSLSRSPSKPARLNSCSQSPVSSTNIFALRTTPIKSFDLSTTTSTPRKKFSVRRLMPTKNTSRIDNARRSPVRRVLSDGSNKSNITRNSSPDESKSDDSDSSFSKSQESESPPLFRVGAETPTATTATARSTPLKRPEAQTQLDTPLKRRSLHAGLDNGLSFSSPIIFAPLPQTDQSNREQNSIVSFSSPVVKRPGISRKSVNRHSQVFSRSRGVQDTLGQSLNQLSPATKARNRLSLDPTVLRNNSSFSRPLFGSLQTSLHPASSQSTRPSNQNQNSHPPSHPHPLSKTFVPSSSSRSSLPEDAKMTVELESRISSIPEFKPIFSKSLPVGAIRPSQDADSQSNSSSSSFATPAAVKTMRHQPGGFMSTGLISKRNRKPDFHPYNDNDRYMMPDTPSKRASYPPVTSTPFRKSTYDSQTPFGDPATPLIFQQNTTPGGLFGRSVNHQGGLFGAELAARRGSFASEDGEDHNLATQDSHSSADELPPTPTKINGSAGRIKANSLRSSLFGRRASLNPEIFAPGPPVRIETDMPKLVRQSKTTDNITPINEKVSIRDHRTRYSPMLSTGKPDVTYEAAISEAVYEASITTSPTFKASTKSYLSTVTPVHNQSTNASSSPLTPQGSFDSRSLEGNGFNLSLFKASTQVIAPMTPTTQRDHALNFVPAGVANDVDLSIKSRFSTVSTIAQGEFSIVYRVEKPVNINFLQGRPPPSPGAAWIVKKMKRPYIGMRDRETRLREVEILRQLKGHDHVLEYLDSWEADSRLYIQTEHCENGSLSSFLSSAGNKARLDDFRVWKMLLELSLGVQAIHNANIIHLDLKPANVFVTFEGVLKIGDFGLASHWPAPKDIEGEGDREYISPEVLLGHLDKPADVFAVGLITLEIAGNFFLPDNGEQWQRLRSGNLSDVPSLTWSTDSRISRDENGDPLDSPKSSNAYSSPSTAQSSTNLLSNHCMCSRDATCTSQILIAECPLHRRSSELDTPPVFMLDENHPHSLDRLVAWMLAPNPADRPDISQVWGSEGLTWVASRRRAGATVYEGNWGPSDAILDHRRWNDNKDASSSHQAGDVEMQDV